MGCYGPRLEKSCRGVSRAGVDPAHATVSRQFVNARALTCNFFKKKIKKWIKNMINKLFIAGNQMKGNRLLRKRRLDRKQAEMNQYFHWFLFNNKPAPKAKHKKNRTNVLVDAPLISLRSRNRSLQISCALWFLLKMHKKVWCGRELRIIGIHIRKRQRRRRGGDGEKSTKEARKNPTQKAKMERTHQELRLEKYRHGRERNRDPHDLIMRAWTWKIRVY